MARLFDDSLSQYLETGLVPVTAPPFSVSGWFSPSGSYASGYPTIFALSDKSVSNDHQWYLALADPAAGDPIRWYADDGVDIQSATSTTGTTAGNSHHFVGVEAAADDRAVFLDGGGKGTNAISVSPSGVDTMSIGRRGDLTPGDYWDGRIAEVAIWNAALFDLEVAALAAGTPPFLIRPMSLRAYWPLLNDDRDWCGNFDMTPYNTPSWAVGPPASFDWERRLYLYQRVALPLRMRLGVR